MLTVKLGGMGEKRTDRNAEVLGQLTPDQWQRLVQCLHAGALRSIAWRVDGESAPLLIYSDLRNGQAKLR
jgi:hypothetical protein